MTDPHPGKLLCYSIRLLRITPLTSSKPPSGDQRKQGIPFADNSPMITSWFCFSGVVLRGFTSTAQTRFPLMQKKSGHPRFVGVHCCRPDKPARQPRYTAILCAASASRLTPLQLVPDGLNDPSVDALACRGCCRSDLGLGWWLCLTRHYHDALLIFFLPYIPPIRHPYLHCFTAFLMLHYTKLPQIMSMTKMHKKSWK